MARLKVLERFFVVLRRTSATGGTLTATDIDNPSLAFVAGTQTGAYGSLVLGSDGLFDNLHLDEIVQRVRKGGMGQAADALRITSRHRMIHADPAFPSKPDDLSYLLFRPRAV